jgi:hypothetical protein
MVNEEIKMETKTVAEKKFIVPKETKHPKTKHETADKLMRENDRVKRWKKIHSLLRTQNKKARKEQDQIAEDCASVRAEKIFKKTPSSKMGLRFGVAMPPMTWNAIVAADRLIYGKCDLSETDKESYLSKNATNQVVKDLEKAFPQYKVT